MSVKPARKLEIVQRRQRVAELYLQGWQQDAIAKELTIRQPMVSEDLAKIRQAWRESAIRDFDAARDLELARLDRIEREAWAAWERSKQPTQSATVNGEAGSQTARRTVKPVLGAFSGGCPGGQEGRSTLFSVSAHEHGPLSRRKPGVGGHIGDLKGSAPGI